MIESVILYWIINMEINLFKIDIMNIDYKVGEVKLSYKPKFKNQQKVTCSEDAYRYMLSTYKKETICYKEYFKVLFLNQANQILGYTLISEGGITETCADVRLIMQAALLTNSVALILAHNHPSGNLKPSPEDIRLTKQVREASNFMRIKILDHIILSDTEYYSFADEGML
jgi:DNA repair protein RadC